MSFLIEINGRPGTPNLQLGRGSRINSWTERNGETKIKPDADARQISNSNMSGEKTSKIHNYPSLLNPWFTILPISKVSNTLICPNIGFTTIHLMAKQLQFAINWRVVQFSDTLLVINIQIYVVVVQTYGTPRLPLRRPFAPQQNRDRELWSRFRVHISE